MTTNVLITGASSTNARAALEALAGPASSAVHVFAGTRSPGADERGANRTEVRFDWEATETHAPALDGIDAAYLILPEHLPNGAELTGNFLDAATRVSLRRLVLLSARGVEEHPWHPLAAVEAAVATSPLPAVVLKPNWLLQNFTDGVFRPNVERGLIAAPGGSSVISFVDAVDVAACAARALLADDLPTSLTLDLTGPEALTFGQVAERLAAGWDRPLRYEEVGIDDPELPQRLGLPPMPDPAPVRALFGRVLDGGEASVSDDVRRFLGRAPTSVDAFAARTRALWADTVATGAP